MQHLMHHRPVPIVLARLRIHNPLECTQSLPHHFQCINRNGKRCAVDDDTYSPPPQGEHAAENGFEHIVLTTEQRTVCPECGDLLRITASGERFCNNTECDNEDLFVLDD